MTPKQVYEYYGSGYKFNNITGMSATTLRNWVRWGKVPEESQYKIERLTKGELKTDWSI
jgi:hypothetical protein